MTRQLGSTPAVTVPVIVVVAPGLTSLPGTDGAGTLADPVGVVLPGLVGLPGLPGLLRLGSALGLDAEGDGEPADEVDVPPWAQAPRAAHMTNVARAIRILLTSATTHRPA
jgi:hypothetical protein